MTTLKGNLKTFLFNFYIKESQAIQSQLFCATHRVKSPLRYPMLVLEAFSATVFDSNNLPFFLKIASCFRSFET